MTTGEPSNVATVVDEKDESPTLTHAPTFSEHGFEPPLHEKPSHLQIPLETHQNNESGYMSPSESREQATRLVDDLTLLQAERAVSNQEQADLKRSETRSRTREANGDVFNQPEKTVHIGIPLEPPSRLSQFVQLIHKLPRIVRYFFYALPVTVLLLIPIFLGIFLPNADQRAIGGPGGVQVLWFGVWLEVVWLSLWAARICTATLPFFMGIVARIFTAGNSRKWRDIGKQLEIHMAFFLWLLAVLISFLPLVTNHKVEAGGDNNYPDIPWIDTVNKVIIAFFVLATLNFAEKILIQWIATNFHLRTYSTRIETNKQNIAYLVHLFEHSRDRLVTEESVWPTGQNTASGTRTPMAAFQNNARAAFTKVGDVANRVAGDFTGRTVKLSNHPRKVVTELLRTTGSAQVLGRRLFRTYAKEESDVLTPDDLRPAFPSQEDADNAFAIIDQDLNGDVSMEELESFCDEAHREKKAIAASLKDLDSVIRKLDQVFFVIIVIIAALVFVSIFSASTAAALSSASTIILGLSWMLSTTAQEFLQSVIFVFVKHPFDVGDRVTIYGNSGTAGRGDDYYVTEISLLYTEFKKMEGHIVQAPNSLLNTLFILNQRRSGSLADVFTLRMKYGTPQAVIQELEARMTEFVLANNRDYGNKVLTELTTFEDVYVMSVNFICFHKGSFQNELMRLIRHNKFAHELMKQMVALGIEQPRRQYQISGRDFPVFQANIQPPSYQDTQPVPSQHVDPSILHATRRRADSRVSVNNDVFQDVFVSRSKNNVATQPFMHPPRIQEESDAAASGIELERFASATSASQRSHQPPAHGAFGRTMTLRRSQENRSRDRSDIV